MDVVKIKAIEETEGKTRKAVLWIFAVIILLPLILFWLHTNFGTYLRSMENQYGFEVQGEQVLIKENLFSSCSISFFDPCSLRRRFINIDSKKFELIKKQTEAAGYSEWKSWSSFEGRIGDYPRDPDDIKGSLTASRDLTNTNYQLLVYHPETQILESVSFSH